MRKFQSSFYEGSELDIIVKKIILHTLGNVKEGSSHLYSQGRLLNYPYRDTHTYTNIQTHRQTKNNNRQAYRQIDRRWTDRYEGKQEDRQTDMDETVS